MALQIRDGLTEPLHYLESKVRFSFSRCDISKFCIQKLEKPELKQLYNTLGKFEKMTWRQARELPRENGISIDKKDGAVYGLLKPRVEACSTFGHFRVNTSGANTRVFVGLDQDLAYLVFIDRKGELQHSG